MRFRELFKLDYIGLIILTDAFEIDIKYKKSYVHQKSLNAGPSRGE